MKEKKPTVSSKLKDLEKKYVELEQKFDGLDRGIDKILEELDILSKKVKNGRKTSSSRK